MRPSFRWLRKKTSSTDDNARSKATEIEIERTNTALEATILDTPREEGSLLAKVDLEDERSNGLKAFVTQPVDRLDCVDIIAIHGLNGNYNETWTDKSTGLNWLRDEQCLQKDIQNARVLSFGYNSKSYFSRSTSDVRDFASELLAAIKTSRRSHVEQRRPIIFLCHSLGGLVFKQVYAKNITIYTELSRWRF
jgi:hypothetical protein